MIGQCFVDANVFVYARDPRDAVKQARAASWIDLLWQRRLGRTSTQVLSEFYAVATRKLRGEITPALAWADVVRYFEWRPHPVDEPLLRRAHEIEPRYGISWWDSMVVAAAQLQDCDVLLTEDLQDGMRFGALTVRSPFTLTAEEPAAEYASVRSAPVHRPRGRPRRLAARA